MTDISVECESCALQFARHLQTALLYHSDACRTVTWRNVLCCTGARVAAFAAFIGAFSSLCASKKAPSDLTQAPKFGCTLMRGRSHFDTWRCVRSSCK